VSESGRIYRPKRFVERATGFDRIQNLGDATTGAEISPTAKLTADLRRNSDIPFADAIAELTDAAGYARGMPGGGIPADVIRWMAPLIEARYKCLSYAIEQAQISQILEFASGFAFRGVAMAAQSSVLYIETDLSEIHQTRQALRQALERTANLPKADSCLFAAADMLSQDDVDRVAGLLRPGEPVAIVHEGIFPYFSADEKHLAASNIARLLRHFGGLWMTPDFKSGHDGIEQLWQSENAQMVGRYLGTSSGRTKPRDTSLSDEAKVHAFLARHGLEGEKRIGIPDLSMLSSASKLNTSVDEQRALQSALALWVIRSTSDQDR
jgi:O-methyltransferase involved in polyketide biosynthesis